MKRLYLFTVKFPYTNYTESFLEDEIQYLSKEFAAVYLVPLERECNNPKKLPPNCIVLTPILNNKVISIFRGLFNWRIFRLLIKEAIQHSVYKDKVKLLNWVKCYYLGNNLLNAKAIKQIGRGLDNNDVCYFYWGKWSNLLSVFWKGRCPMVSRFHGEFDLWEEVHHGFVPLRQYVVRALDCAVFISRKGEDYFHKKYPVCRTHYSPLGSNKIDVIESESHSGLKILSCSSIIPLKRVLLIYQSLLEICDVRVSWTHIGGGSEYETLSRFISEHPQKNITVVLKGAMSHNDVINFYGNNRFDVFINLSTIEGVPVSIMEAISCDIPVVATNVGGTCEVVTEETGILVSPNPSTTEVANAIKMLYHKKLNPYLYWIKHYDAEKNYNEFAVFLAAL